MGIEMGANSHKPHSPSQVLSQRFGDCKDKAYLLCTVLNALGIEAYPVLNNTTYKKTISEWLPTPRIFDHCTVCVKLENKTYWFDGTIAYQRGSLADISYPDYQIGLVLKPGTTSLTKINLQDKGKIATQENFYVKSLGGAVQLITITNFTGSFADNVRTTFKNSNLGEMMADYKKLYTPYFEKMDADSLRYQDNEETGMFTTTEYYTIRDFWKNDDNKQIALLEPYLISSILKKPATDKRQHPLSLAYPARYSEQINIHLPEDWPITTSTLAYNTPSFALDFEYSRPANDLVRLTYNYESLADHITAESLPDYLEKLHAAEESIAFKLTSTGSGSLTMNTNSTRTNGYSIAYTILGFCVLATYAYRKSVRKNNGSD